MSGMSQNLCDEGLDINGEVSVTVEEGVGGKKMGFRVKVGDVVIVVRRKPTPREVAPLVLAGMDDDDDPLPAVTAFIADEHLKEAEQR